MIIKLKSKLTGINVTDCDIDYEGSITIDRNLLRKVGIEQYEQVHVLDRTNGQRFVTYAIDGATGVICVNGAAARLVNIGDDLIVLAYEITNNASAPLIIDARNYVHSKSVQASL
jgi:aspartate 1-decarboxylase